MQHIKNIKDVAFYRLHNQTKETGPASTNSKNFLRLRSVEVNNVYTFSKEHMRAPVVKLMAERQKQKDGTDLRFSRKM
jgi:hypothetical protein